MKDFRLLSLSNSLLAWLDFLARTATNAFSGAPLPSLLREKGMNIFEDLSKFLEYALSPNNQLISIFFTRILVQFPRGTIES